MSESPSTNHEPVWDGAGTPGPADESRSDLLALVVTEGDQTACTIYPPDVAVPYRTTTWITAHGESFVSLEDWR